MSFSPGTWHLDVPRNLEDNLRFRLFLLEKTRNDLALRNDLIHSCRHDILFYINVFVTQLNPNATNREVGPFITWDF